MNKSSEKVARYRLKMKIRLMEYKGNKCQKCGYDKPVVSAYDFHHRNPDEKEFQIGGSTLGFEKLKAEVDKCDLLCRNCHAEVHDAEWTDYRNALLNNSRKRQTCVCNCLKCGNPFTQKRKEQKFCSRKCQHESMRVKDLDQVGGSPSLPKAA